MLRVSCALIFFFCDILLLFLAADACCEQDITNTFDPATLRTLGHTQYSGQPVADATMPMLSGAHPQREVGGDATFRWGGQLSVDPLRKSVVRLFRDEADPANLGSGVTRRQIGIHQQL